MNRRTRSRRRNRRSRNQSRQQRQRSVSQNGGRAGGNAAYHGVGHYIPPALREPIRLAPPSTQYRDDGRRSAYQNYRAPSPSSASHLHQATSVVSSAFNRFTEFLRPGRTAGDGSVSAVMFDEGFSNDGGRTKLCDDPSAILIQPAASKIVFQCQLAHGSPTALISEFKNPTELYQKIADSYDDVEPEHILFCTRNTHRIDMEAVLCGTLTITDFIFAHIRGQKKEVELVKKEKLLGFTLSDNWAGRVFVRKIHPSSQIAASRPAVDEGDHIEAINGESVVGKRHYQVAKLLQKIPVGSTLTLRLISPLKSGFSFIAPRAGARKITTVVPPVEALADGAQTIRFKSDGTQAVIQEPANKVILNRINDVFDRYLGFNDDELANTIFDIGRECATLNEMKERCMKSTLKDFEFTPELLFDLWGAVDDWKHDRLKPDVMTKSKDNSAVGLGPTLSKLHTNDDYEDSVEIDVVGDNTFHTTKSTGEQSYEDDDHADDSHDTTAYTTAGTDEEAHEKDGDEGRDSDEENNNEEEVEADLPSPPNIPSPWDVVLRPSWQRNDEKRAKWNDLDVD